MGGRRQHLGNGAAGLQVVRADGTRLDPWRGSIRSLTFPLGFLTLGLGFLGIFVQREHRALYDLIAGTAVVYAWDARAARLRFLARQAEPVVDAAAAPTLAKPVAVTADGPGPVGQADSEVGSDTLASLARTQNHPLLVSPADHGRVIVDPRVDVSFGYDRMLPRSPRTGWWPIVTVAAGDSGHGRRPSRLRSADCARTGARRRLTSSSSASRSSASVSMNSFTNIGCMMSSPGPAAVPVACVPFSEQRTAHNR